MVNSKPTAVVDHGKNDEDLSTSGFRITGKILPMRRPAVRPRTSPCSPSFYGSHNKNRRGRQTQSIHTHTTRAVRNTVPLEVLCSVQKRLLRLGRRHKLGEEYGSLNAEQVQAVRDFIRTYYSPSLNTPTQKTTRTKNTANSSTINNTVNDGPTSQLLLDLSYVLGRWITPKELKAVYGDSMQLFSRLYRVENAKDGKEATIQVPQDPRISFMIGSQGHRLNGVIERSGCIFIYFHNQSTVAMFSSGRDQSDAEARMQTAAAIMNRLWNQFSSTRHGAMLPALRVGKPSFVLPVSMSMLEKAISNR